MSHFRSKLDLTANLNYQIIEIVLVHHLENLLADCTCIESFGAGPRKRRSNAMVQFFAFHKISGVEAPKCRWRMSC